MTTKNCFLSGLCPLLAGQRSENFETAANRESSAKILKGILRCLADWTSLIELIPQKNVAKITSGKPFHVT